jgi:hydrogenase nickel incorporation protein HypB
MEQVRLISVKKGIDAENRKVAADMRAKAASNKTLLVNLMASPGAGKTTLILGTIAKLREKVRIGVIEADIDSTVDSEKIAAQGIKAVQLRTGGCCHLDATMVASGLESLDLNSFDLIIIENIGNLICPAGSDTGAGLNAMILSVPEGDDKPLKYPLMFSMCDVLVVSKIDYLDKSDFDLGLLRQRVLRLNPNIEIFEVSAKTGEGMNAWAQWLEDRVHHAGAPPTTDRTAHSI